MEQCCDVSIVLKCEIRFVLLTVKLNSALVKMSFNLKYYKTCKKKRKNLLPSDTAILLR